MSLWNIFCSILTFDALKSVFGKRRPRGRKPLGLPWMGGNPYADEDLQYSNLPHSVSHYDESLYDDLQARYDLLETRIEDMDNDDFDFETSLAKVSELLNRDDLSGSEYDLVSRALDNLESRIDDYEDRLVMDASEMDDEYSDDLEWEHEDIEEELDDILGDDFFDDYDDPWKFSDDEDDDFRDDDF